MLNIISRVDGLMSSAWLFNRNLIEFKYYTYVYSKLAILKSVTYEDPMPFFFPASNINVQSPMFYILMSHSTEVRDFLVRNIEQRANDIEDLEDEYDLNRQIIYNTLMMLGK